MDALPETRYAESDGLGIAYQVMGEGPVDLVHVPQIVSHVEFSHALPGYTATVLFTDIVGSTEHAARPGDRQ